MNAGNAFPSLFSEVPEVFEFFYLLGWFSWWLFWFLAVLKSTKQLLKSKLHGEIFRFSLGNSLIAERCTLIAVVVQKVNVEKPQTAILSPG